MSRLHAMLHWLDPRKPNGMSWRRWRHVIALKIVILACVFATIGGSAVAIKYGPSWYRSHFHVEHAIYAHVVPAVVSSSPGVLPPSAHVDWRYLSGVHNQGQVGTCAAWQFADQLSYLVNRAHAATHLQYFSPCWFYTLLNHGADAGALSSDLTQIEDRYGAVLLRDFHCPPGVLPKTVPSGLPVQHIALWQQWLGVGTDEGARIIPVIKQNIHAGRIVDTGIMVYQNLWDASLTGEITLQTGAATGQAHDLGAVAYDDAHRFADGELGGVLEKNQWGPEYGVGRDGIRHAGPHNGYVWVSYGFIEQHVDSVGILHLGVQPSRVPSLRPVGRYHLNPKQARFINLIASAPANQIDQLNHKLIKDGEAATCYQPPWTLFRLSAVWGTYSSYYGYDNGIINAYACQDTDYMVPYAAEEILTLPGGSWIHYTFLWTGFADGSGYYMVFQAPNGGRFAYLHVHNPWAFAPGQMLRGNDVVGHSGWPFSYAYSGGSCYDYVSCESDAHLCLVTDQGGGNWMYTLVYHPPAAPRPKPRPKPRLFPSARWNAPVTAHNHKDPRHKWPYVHYRYRGRITHLASEWAWNGYAFGRRQHIYAVCGSPTHPEYWDARNKLEKQDLQHCVAYHWPRVRGDPVKWERTKR